MNKLKKLNFICNNLKVIKIRLSKYLDNVPAARSLIKKINTKSNCIVFNCVLKYAL